jgi:hypothetical protein
MTLTTTFLGASAALWMTAIAVGGAAMVMPGPPEIASPIRYDADGTLQRPDHREWVFLGAGLDMTYGAPSGMGGAAQMHMFTNVFVNPAAYRAFKTAGTWPDQTIFMLEVRHSGTDRRPNRAGMFQTEAVGLEAHVKDASKGGWRFYDFEDTGSGKPLPATSSCNTCHAEHGAVDNTFVQFYPELLAVAKARGTIKPGFDLDTATKP